VAATPATAARAAALFEARLGAERRRPDARTLAEISQ